jgi:hypothetical protein
MSFENNEENSFYFVDDAEVQSLNNPQETIEQTDPQEGEMVVESEENQNEDYTGVPTEDVDSAVLSYLSERFGRSISSYDDLVEYREQERAIDERVSIIADFVEKTGRDPRDWFIYQSINPSEMDDLSVVKLNMSAEYPNLSQEEIDILVNSKYKTNPDVHGEDEVTLSKLQLKIDAESARRSIDQIRNDFQAPVAKSEDYSSIVNDEWISDMARNLDEFQGIEFDLGGKKFMYSVDDRYKSALFDKNSRLDEFFDPYVREDGSWDYDMLNMHRTVLDNMNSILTSAYRQGISDGQKGIVNRAANVSTKTPNQGGAQNQQDALTAQLREAMGLNGGGIKFL